MQKENMGEKHNVTINLDGGTITPLIQNDFWFDPPPLMIKPPNKQPPPLGNNYLLLSI